MTRFLPTVTALSIALVSASAIFAAPASADRLVTEPVTLKYDVEKLKVEGAVNDVLLQLEGQAKDLCMTIRPVLNTEQIDRTCVETVMFQAVAGINDAALTEAFKLSDAYRNIVLADKAETQS